MTSSQKIKCNAIIHSATAAAAAVGGGLAQVPTSDNAVITPIQLSMTIALGKVFNVSITQSSAMATIASVSAAAIGRTASQVLVGWIPGVGNAINAITAAVLTESMGWLIADQFDKGILG